MTEQGNPRSPVPEKDEGEAAPAKSAAVPDSPESVAAETAPPEEAPESKGESEQRGSFFRIFNPLRWFRRNSPKSLVRQARQLAEWRNFAQATVVYGKALELDANYADAYLGLGDLLVRKGGRRNAEAALERYKEAATRDLFNQAAYKGAARVYSMLGKRKESALEMKKMVVVRTLQSDPDNAKANNNMGILFLQLGQASSALKYFQKALKTDPRYETALRNLGVANFKLANESTEPDARAAHLKTARENIDKALELAEQPITLLTKARICMLDQNFAEALAACERVEAIDATIKDVFAVKKAVLMQLGRHEEANKAYETYMFLSAHG